MRVADRWAQLPPSNEIARRVQAPRVQVPREDSFERGQAVLLYNGECSVCRAVSNWVKRTDEPKNGGKQRIDERPIGHDPAPLSEMQIDIWDAYEKVHVVMPDGQIKKGGEAVGEVLRRLPPTQWMGPALDVSIFGFRPMQKLVDAGYYVLDRIRPALGCESCGTPVPWWGKPVEWGFKAWKAISS